MQKLIKGPMKGYKAMDDNMQCRGFQFEIGKTYVHDGELVECESGFHFCEQPSGVWCYYNSGRLFEIEAYDVLDTNFVAGADYKRVCKKIKIVREVMIDGDYNTGNGNTGYRNTGNRNTGYRNTGNGNTGNRNTGYYNTGDYNTGNRNTGYYNTGDYNTGNYNTGYRNTGYCNACNYSSGFFGYKDPPITFFGVKSSIKREDLDWPLIRRLHNKLESNVPFDPTPFLSLPNATPRRIKKLHNKFIELRKD